MQRKNDILNPKRHGFAMIMAIFLMVLIGGMMAASISMSSTSTKKTENDYLHEQAQLLARSSTEYALLAISGHDPVANNGCINTINMVYPNAVNPMFDIRIDLQYILFNGGVAIPNCAPMNGTGGVATTVQSNGTVMMDVVVSDNALLNLSEPIRYHRRTIQKL